MPTKIQLRRGPSTEWTSANPLLASGELGLETDTKKFKIGDGSAYWNSLPYSSITQIAVETLIDTALEGYVPNTTTINGYELTSNIAITKSDVGLGNVDNTADIDKPVSTAQQEAIEKAAFYFSIAL